MKIAFNPSTVAALITPPNNKDITFDLRGRNIFARGVKFQGTDTWRDIKINNVSIGSNILDLRNGSNTTLTNTNGVVTINSTWRPVVDNLTSDSTTSSLSANQGRVLKALIDGKSNSGHTHDDRYLRLTGGWMSGDINFGSDNKIYWGRNTDSASISFKNDGDGDTDSYMSFVTSDNGNEYFRWSHSSGSTNTEWMALRSDGLRVGGTKVSLEGHSHNDLYYTKIEVNNKLNGKSNTGHTHDDRYLKLTGGTMQLGEGLKFHADENYFGTYSDARIISLLDNNDKICDGGLIIDERATLDGKEYVTELLRIRDSEFKWKGSNILHSGNTYVSNNKGYINNTEITQVNNSDTVDGYHASSLVKFYLSPMTSNAPADSAKNWFVNTLPSSSGAIVYNVPGKEKTIIAGKSSGAHGHMLQLNYDDNYLRILRYRGGSWLSTDWEKISAGYADSAGSVAWDNVTGKPSSYTPSAHTHSWMSITDKLVAGNEFNIVNAGFNGDMWFNYVPINDRSKTATINSYYFGNGHQGLASVTASGFVKNGSSSSYVLLGDGGHKLISDFATNNHTHSNYVTALGTNGNYLTWTKNGSTNNITVPYATTSSYLTSGFSATYVNKWDCNAPDRVVYSDYGSNGRSITNAPSEWNYGTLLELGHTNYRGLNGVLNIQLMWDVAHNTTRPGTLWFRGKDEVNGWAKNWAKVITDQNISSILSNYYTKSETDGKYVTLTTPQTIGGSKTFTTGIKFNVNNDGDANLGSGDGFKLFYNGTSGSNFPGYYYNVASFMTGYTGFQLACYGGYDQALKYRHRQDNGTWHPWKTLAFTTDIPSSLKNPYSLTLQANGTTLATYDGSVSKIVNLTYDNVGAAAKNHTHNSLEPWASYITGDSHATALKSLFNENKTSIPRDKFISMYSSVYGNSSYYMGYFLNGYENNPYGGFFVAHYDAAYYIGIQNGSFTQHRLVYSTDIPNSLKNPHALTISLNGTSQGPYDGSAAKNINITPSSIGAATSGHNHDDRYLKLTGGNISGTISIRKDLSGNLNDWIQKQHYGPLEVGRASNTMCVAIGVTDDNYGYIQTKGQGITTPGNLVLLPGGGNLYKGTINNVIWHAGNDGANSGLDADLLDGNHASAFATVGHKHNNYLVKTTYDYHGEISFGSSGKCCLGKFPMYDSCITIDIAYTTSGAYFGKLVIGTQNINNSRGGVWTARVFGDDSGVITYRLSIRYASGSNQFQVYFNCEGWGKFAAKIHCCALAGTPSDICTQVTSIPTDNLIGIIRAYNNPFNFLSSEAHIGCNGAYSDPLPEVDVNFKFGGVLAATHIYSNGGFHKNGSSDSYVLLGGGGHQTISSLSVNYANSAGSATKVIVNQHTTNDANYPLVWSDQNNSNTVTENQLFKSWSDLYYNPKNKRLTVGGSVVASSFVKSGGTSQQLLRADGGIATFNWSGQSGQPTWLWGGNNEHSYYVYNPSNFRVAYATSAGSADTLDGVHLSGIFTAFGNNGHNITATIGGVTKSFLVNWAADSDKLDGYHVSNLLTSVTNTNNGISVTVGGTTKSVSNISVNYANSAGSADTAQYLRSLGNQNCQTGRTQNYGDVYTYNTYDGNTGSPTTFTSVIGFGRGISGTVEIAGGWDNTNLYWRSLRDCCEDWHSWRTVLDSSNYTEFINNYYWANVKISTSSSTTTSPTVYTLTATRVCAGHNPGIDNSISCSNWFRSSGATGWYNTTYNGGWYMSDTSWIRAHNGVGIYTSGKVKASGFHHVNHDNDDAVLLAGGSYKTLNSIYGGDSNHPVFLGYLNLDHGNDGTVSSSFYCLGYSVPFTYTRGGNYCKISIPDTTHQAFYIKAATASVNYSGGGMDTWTGNHRGAGAWWLHCYAPSSNEVRVKGFHLKDTNNDSWWGGNPLWSDRSGVNRITVCIFGYVTFR